jgi:hypothetical protein
VAGQQHDETVAQQDVTPHEKVVAEAITNPETGEIHLTSRYARRREDTSTCVLLSHRPCGRTFVVWSCCCMAHRGETQQHTLRSFDTYCVNTPTRHRGSVAQSCPEANYKWSPQARHDDKTRTSCVRAMSELSTSRHVAALSRHNSSLHALQLCRVRCALQPTSHVLFEAATVTARRKQVEILRRVSSTWSVRFHSP